MCSVLELVNHNVGNTSVVRCLRCDFDSVIFTMGLQLFYRFTPQSIPTLQLQLLHNIEQVKYSIFFWKCTHSPLTHIYAHKGISMLQHIKRQFMRHCCHWVHTLCSCFIKLYITDDDIRPLYVFKRVPWNIEECNSNCVRAKLFAGILWVELRNL